MECDIALSNPLAISNTRLLRTYSEVDPRVRELAFVVKKWAKARHVNSPGDGTLSSYGFILCMLHFLQVCADCTNLTFSLLTYFFCQQTRPVPVVPNLQKLPPAWNGERDYSAVLGDVAADALLRKIEVNSADSLACNTYFYVPSAAQPTLLRVSLVAGLFCDQS